MYFPEHRSIQLISPTFSCPSLYLKLHFLKQTRDRRSKRSAYDSISIFAIRNCDVGVDEGCVYRTSSIKYESSDRIRWTKDRFSHWLIILSTIRPIRNAQYNRAIFDMKCTIIQASMR
ncbi:unnamed protein product [Albugo candida]|uniref:Uncharacterized protein n=1 Tax=Albugo candida TaxID=65357 RepID=A0A024FTI7_9STRA|nr:unnamed protein product [Albugo candida]|eukprot:CCI10341.1 unnamed protein product [Albugo candida]